MAIEAIGGSRLVDDPRLADYRDVADAELVGRRGLFVAEGRLVVRRVLDDRRYRVRSLLLNEAARVDLGDRLDRLEPAVPVLVAETAAFRSITGFDLHRGCLALVERPPATTLADLL